MNGELNIIEDNTRNLSNQVHRLGNACHLHESYYGRMQDEVNSLRMYNKAQEGIIANLEYRIQIDEQQISHTDNRAMAAEIEVEVANQRLTDLMNKLARMFGGN